MGIYLLYRCDSWLQIKHIQSNMEQFLIKILVYYKNYINFIIFNVRQEFYVSMNLKNYNKDRDVKKASFSVNNLHCFQQMQHET